MIEVIPAIIPEDFQLLTSEMEQVKEYVSLVQVDVIDGQFAPEATWPYVDDPGQVIFDEIVAGERGFPFWKELQFEVDLMIEKPEKVIDDWIAAGTSAVIVHADSTQKHEDIFDKLAQTGTGIGLALKPTNSNELVEQFREQIDFVQLMGNDKIGYHGVELDSLVYDKLKDLRSRFPDLSLAVDIGVNFETGPKLVRSGATRLVSGSTIFESEDTAAAIEALKNTGGQ